MESMIPLTEHYELFPGREQKPILKQISIRSS